MKIPNAFQPTTVTLPYSVWIDVIQNLQWAQGEAEDGEHNPGDDYTWRARTLDMLSNRLAAGVDANFTLLEPVYIYERPCYQWYEINWVAEHTLWHFQQYALQHLSGENPFLYHEVTHIGAQRYYPVVEEIEGSFRFSLYRVKKQVCGVHNQTLG